MKNRLFGLALLLLVGLFSCSKKDQACALDEEILSQDLTVELVRLDQEFFAGTSASDFLHLMEKYPDFARNYLQVDQYYSPDTLAALLVEVHQDSAMRALYDSVQVEFADISDIQQDLEHAFKYIKHYYPNFQAPKVYTFVSGFNSDLVVTPEMIVIGLDYYLPKDHSFQPDIARYMAERYERSYLVPMIVLAISSRYNTVNPEENTLLSEMIYYGKAYHFVKAIMPCTSDQFIIGYTPEEISECYANEEFIWAHFVENELLYETSPLEIRKYIGEAPFTDAISTNAPGRLGRWIGWNIVDDYQASQDLDLPLLMMEADSEKIFRQSGYRPRSQE